LLTNHLIVLVLGMGLAAVLTWRVVETLYLNTQRQNLSAQAALTAAALQGTQLPTSSSAPYLQSTNVLPGIHTRLLGEQGAVLVELSAASDQASVQVPTAENRPDISPDELLQRPEIVQALQGEVASSVRRVASAGNRRVLYAAAPIRSEDGMVAGLVYLATPLPATGLPTSWLLPLAVAGLAAAGLAALAASRLAREIARPVEAAARAAAAVGAGDLSHDVHTEASIQELESLGNAFNQMTESLRRSEQAKNAFVADVAHELRTPLTVIKGTIETLEDGAVDDRVGRGPLLTSMHRETDRLIRLVNGLLVLMRADAGALDLRLQPVDLEDLARARCEHCAPLATRRQVSLVLRLEGSSGPAWVRGDRDRLAQVLDNLLDNALRYSPPGRTVQVILGAVGGEWECRIRDQGPGIPAGHLPLIFERFYRADASLDRRGYQAGLGLAIARALLVAQGGRISAECPADGGTLLRFALPVLTPAPQSPPI
jgi:signal transduction histidine kinase